MGWGECRVHVFEAVENAHRPVGPVKLIEVDVIGLRPFEARIDDLSDLATALRSRRAISAEAIKGVAASDLGGDKNLVALLWREPSADDGLSAALRFGLGKHRIDFGGVKDVDAAIDRILHARPRSSARRRSWCRGKLAHACAAEFAITHDAPKIGARLRGDHDEIDGAVLLDLLLGTLRREEGGEEKP